MSGGNNYSILEVSEEVLVKRGLRGTVVLPPGSYIVASTTGRDLPVDAEPSILADESIRVWTSNDEGPCLRAIWGGTVQVDGSGKFDWSTRRDMTPEHGHAFVGLQFEAAANALRDIVAAEMRPRPLSWLRGLYIWVEMQADKGFFVPVFDEPDAEDAR